MCWSISSFHRISQSSYTDFSFQKCPVLLYYRQLFHHVSVCFTLHPSQIILVPLIRTETLLLHRKRRSSGTVSLIYSTRRLARSPHPPSRSSYSILARNLAHLIQPPLSLDQSPPSHPRLTSPTTHLKFLRDTSKLIRHSLWSTRGCISPRQLHGPYHNIYTHTTSSTIAVIHPFSHSCCNYWDSCSSILQNFHSTLSECVSFFAAPLGSRQK